MDTRTPDQRSRIMRSVGSKDTGPEMIVRRLIHRMGFRYRLHQKSLPGSPDLVLKKHHSIIFIHGCFWHGHSCSKGRLPKSRLDFWVPKIKKNRSRDARSLRLLRADGWRVLTVWQCEKKDFVKLGNQLRLFLSSTSTPKNRKRNGHKGALK
jgi:DNA mismatch endonuclease, patch repair protein